MTADLIHKYKDGNLNLDIMLHQPQIGEKVEVKVLDKGQCIWINEKNITSPNDTLFKTQHLFPNILPWNAETPNTYLLVINTFDKQGNALESFTHPFGF
jgi:beta-galactosidase